MFIPPSWSAVFLSHMDDSLGISILLRIRTSKTTYEYVVVISRPSEAFVLAPGSRLVALGDDVFPVATDRGCRAELLWQIEDGLRFPLLDGGGKEKKDAFELYFTNLVVHLQDGVVSGAPCGFYVREPTQQQRRAAQAFFETVSTLHEARRIARAAQCAIEAGASDEELERARFYVNIMPERVKAAMDELARMQQEAA